MYHTRSNIFCVNETTAAAALNVFWALKYVF